MAVQIFHYAKDGLLKVLCAALNDMDPLSVKRVIEMEVMNNLGERLTPLIVATKHGHRKVVKLLLERFGADVNKCGALRVDDLLLEQVSPLWVAAGGGFINIVKDLVEAGANINHRTDTGSTPIRAACFDGRLEVVKYLADCGANVEIANEFNNTCLMIASYRGHFDIVEFLISIGAQINRQALCGATALHFAAEFGHGEIIRRLLEAGAVVMYSKAGLTPMMLAAEQARAWVVELFINRPELHLSKQMIIDVVELLGASFANDQKNYNLEKCLKYLRLGMKLRFEDPARPIEKPYSDLVPAYENRIESQTLQELEAIAQDPNALHMESLIIRQRLLGPKYTSDSLIPIVLRGILLAEEGRFDRCIALWIHRLKLLKECDACFCISKEIHQFAMMYSRIISLQQKIEVEDITFVLSTAHYYLTRLGKLRRVGYNKTQVEDEKGLLVLSILELFLIVSIPTYTTASESDLMNLKEIIFTIIRLDVRSSNGKSLLHLACDPYTKVNVALSAMGVRFPNEHVIALLLECGSDINAVDNDKNTPLHLIVSPYRPVREFADTQKVISLLIEKGAHVDAVNKEGLEPIQAASSAFVQLILKAHYSVKSLMCIAARAVNDHGLHLNEPLPPALLNFIEMHGSGPD